MTTITLAHPHRFQPTIQVFGLYSGPDDRYVFGVREFARDDLPAAEAHARRMVEKFGADHFERVRRDG